MVLRKMTTRISFKTLLCVCVSLVTGQIDDLSRHQEPSLMKEDLKTITFDDIMRNLLPGHRNDIPPESPSSETLMELDIMATKEQMEQFYGRRNKNRRDKRKAVKNAVHRWPNGRIPYVILEGGYQLSNYDSFMIKVAMREWEKYTCVRFTEKRHDDKNFVVIRNGKGCTSQLGMVGGGQDLILDKSGCRFKGLYLHELGHVIGLIHEHQRPIRDDWIDVIEDNVDPDMRIWFEKYDESSVDRYDVDYEYSSVMHYGITAFSKTKNGTKLQTIRAKMPGKEHDIGRVFLKELSFTDVKSVNRMYKCDALCRPDDPQTPKCTDEGFLDQHCRCVCKDGSSDCTVGKVVDKNCTNFHSSDWICSAWAKQNECVKNEKYMMKNCRKACGACGETFGEYEATAEESCDDYYDKETCEKWKENYDCIVNEQWMRRKCKRTCGFCDINDLLPDMDCNNTYTNNEKCERWAKKGECAINPRWMPFNCQRACRTCLYNRNKTKLEDETKGADCNNTYSDDDQCESWAKRGECYINRAWMPKNCQKACRTCPEIEDRNEDSGTDLNTSPLMPKSNKLFGFSTTSEGNKALPAQAMSLGDKAEDMLKSYSVENLSNTQHGATEMVFPISLLIILVKNICY